MGGLSELPRTLAGIVAEGGTDGPARIGAACLAALPLTGAAITVMATADRQEPIWVSGDVAGRLAELQFRLGEGPCVEAFAGGRPVLVPDLTEAGGHQWPVFAAAARQTSARALFSLPLQVGAIGIGVLDLYHDEPGLLGAAELAAALRSADAALWALLGLRSGQPVGPSTTATDGWLAGSPLRHTVVYQATGMVMVQLGVPPEAALSRLRAHAFVHDRAIDEVARDVVARTLRFEESRR